jgi:adenylosuccinate synthase
MANAGHTAVLPCEKRFIAKALPSTALLNVIEGYDPEIIIGSTAAFHLDRLIDEIAECGKPNVTVHPRSGVITEYHKAAESSGENSTKHLASTMQGCGAFLCDKIMRKRDASLAYTYSELAKYVNTNITTRLELQDSDYLPSILMEAMNEGYTMLHEGSQGFSLGINHGSSYPNCTSRECTATQNLVDMGLPISYMGDIYLSIRPFPIRVGNVVENGVKVGDSGGCYDDHEETSWEAIAKECGAPRDLNTTELTTVTKRVRRCFTWSDKQFSRAVAVNGATKIALNFANYIDWSCYGKNDYDDLGSKVHDWVKRVEDKHQLKVDLVSTGPRVDQVCQR